MYYVFHCGGKPPDIRTLIDPASAKEFQVNAEIEPSMRLIVI